MIEMLLNGIVVSLCKVESPRAGGGRIRLYRQIVNNILLVIASYAGESPLFWLCPAHHFPRVEAEH